MHHCCRHSCGHYYRVPLYDSVCLTECIILFCFSAEYDHVLSLEEQRKLAEAANEEVAIETNAANGKDQLQARQVTMETNLAYGLRSESELQENPAAESEDYSNSDPHSPPLLEPADTTGYASIMHR